MNDFNFSEHARLMGRFDVSNPGIPVAAWVNSAIFLSFEGKEITMTAESFAGLEGLNRNNYFEIVLDGIAVNWFEMELGKKDYILESDLDPGVHTIEIHKRTELFYGKVAFYGFSLPKGGKFYEPPKAKNLRLEYFGDSITNGCGIGHPHEVASAPHQDDGYMSYVGISARLLQAEYHTIAFSGIGVLQDAAGNINGLPAHFYGIHGAKTPAWNFSNYTADGVIINLGQNDYTTSINEEDYINAYIEFINMIFSKYPNAYIFCCVGTMNNKCLNAVERVVANFNGKKVYFVDLGLIVPEVEGLGGVFHPGYQTHYRMGVDLANYISGVTNWPLMQRSKIATWIK